MDELNPYLQQDYLNMNFGMGAQPQNQFGVPQPYSNTGNGLFNNTNPTGNKTMGAINGGINAISGLASLGLGYKKYGLAKDELAFQKEQAGINNQNQMTTLNNLMSAQADNRRIATSGATPTGEEYVAQRGIRV